MQDDWQAPVTVKNLPGRGYGVIATSAIEAGTLILAEEPLVKVSDRKRDVEACVSALAQPQQDRYYALHDNFSGMYAPVEGIFKTNAIQLGDTGYGGVFALASRLNSSCRPNVAVTWSEKQGRIVLHAIESIQEADELCICYISPLATRQERRLELLERYKFLCKCPACTATEPEGLSSDERRRRIGELDDYLQSQLRVDPLRSLQLAEEALSLLDAEGLSGRRFHFSSSMYQSYLALRDIKKARVWAAEAYGNARLAFGEEDERTMEFKEYSV